MTQAEKIAKLIQVLEKVILAVVSNDRQEQLDYAREAEQIRQELLS